MVASNQDWARLRVQSSGCAAKPVGFGVKLVLFGVIGIKADFHDQDSSIMD